MKYIFKKTLYNFFRKNIKYLLFYYFILIIYFLSCYIIYDSITIDNFIYSLGIKYLKNDNLLNSLIFLWQFGFHLFIILQIFDSDYISLILSRMNKTKYFLTKLLSIIIIQTFIYIPFLIFIPLFNIKTLKYIIISYIFYILIELIYFTIYILLPKYKYILILILTLLIITGIIPIYHLETYIIYIIVTIITLLLSCYILINNNIINIIELEAQNENRN